MTGDRMTQKEYRAYLLEKGIKPATAFALSKGGQQVASGKGNKYHAKPVRDPTTGKQQYASRKEGKRGAELDLLQSQGIIHGLKKQPRYRFKDNRARGMTRGIVFDSGRVAEYWPDFEYYDDEGELIVEDVKGMKSGTAYSIFKLKKALMWAYFGIEVREI